MRKLGYPPTKRNTVKMKMKKKLGLVWYDGRSDAPRRCRLSQARACAKKRIF